MTRRRLLKEPYSKRHMQRLIHQNTELSLSRIVHVNNQGTEDAFSSSEFRAPDSSKKNKNNFMQDIQGSPDDCNDESLNDEFDGREVIDFTTDHCSNIHSNENVEFSRNHVAFENETQIDEIVLDERNEIFQSDIRNWAIQFSIKHNAIGSLLSILKKHTNVPFPVDSRTLLKTPTCTEIVPMPGGKYYHHGLQRAVALIVKNRIYSNNNNRLIELLIGSDGASISGKSSAKNVWVILCSDTMSKMVYTVGIFHGEGKPDNANDFLKMFVEEAVSLVSNGFVHEGVLYNIKVHALICDAPAKAFLLGTKYHSGYSSCSKCDISGEYIDGSVCFPHNSRENLRTDAKFKNHEYEEYQSRATILNQIPNLGLVSCVPVEYMHLVCLGVMRKLLLLWLKGPLTTRLPPRTVVIISCSLLELQKSVPSDFARVPRSLKHLKLWKATEFRQFLLYLGPIVLKNHLREVVYDNFLTLHVAITILVNPHFAKEPDLIDYAENLLKHFVSSFKTIYGAKYISYNVHGLLHLAQDVRTYGPLDAFSAFRFESYIGFLAKIIRSGTHVLSQLSRRLIELENTDLLHSNEHLHPDDFIFTKQHSNGPVTHDVILQQQYKILRHTKNFEINCNNNKNNCIILQNGIIVEAVNFGITENNQKYVIGKILKPVENIYEVPCNSMRFGICIVERETQLKSFICNNNCCKLYKISYKNKLYVLPILHC